MTYPNPSPVTELQASWISPSGSTQEIPGINLSWKEPVVPAGDGTIGGYNVYVLLANDSTNAIQDQLFASVESTVKKIPFSNSYQLVPPATTIFFPFSWSTPTNYDYPSFANDIESGGSNEIVEYLQSADAYSFRVEVFLTEDESITSTKTGVTIFRPNATNNGKIIASHFNPRFTIKSTSNFNTLNQYSPPGNVEVFQQDSYEDVASCVEMILNTPKYYRTMVPDFGIDDPTFTTNLDGHSIEMAVSRWEPRAGVEISINNNLTNNSNENSDSGQAQINVKIISIEKTKI